MNDMSAILMELIRRLGGRVVLRDSELEEVLKDYQLQPDQRNDGEVTLEIKRR